MMYQQQPLYMVRIGDGQLRPHYPKREAVPAAEKMGDGHRQQQYNSRTYKKKNNTHNQWSNNYRNIRVLTGLGAPLPPPPEVVCPRPPSRDSQTDSSSEDLSFDPNNKGVNCDRRLHEVNSYHTQFVHSYAVPLQSFPPLQRSHSPQQGYNKRRQNGTKHNGSPPNQRRNKTHNNTSGFHRQAPDRYLARSQLVEVRDTPSHLVTGSKWDQLSTDIWRRFIGNQQTTEYYVKKMNLFKHLYNNIKVHLGYSVFVVGSTFNGFGTNTSDLDLCLVIRNMQLADARQDAIQRLLYTHQLLTQLNFTVTEFERLELIEAKVPLLKFHHSVGVDVDVNCNNWVTIRNTHLLHCYAKADWRVQPLVLVVKLWAQAHQINDAKSMTISSYSLALMVIHFLQCATEPAVLPCLQQRFPDKFHCDQEIHNIQIQETLELPATDNTQSLGELLLQFLQYYNYFNFEEDAISVRLGTTIPVDGCRRFVSPKNEPRAWTFLCIEEPFDRTNTARSVYDQDKFDYIRKVFRVSYECLKQTQSLESIFSLKVT